MTDADRDLLVRLGAKLEALEEKTDRENKEKIQRIDELKKEVKTLRDYANKWKGGFVVLVGLGSLAVFFVDQFWKFIEHLKG